MTVFQILIMVAYFTLLAVFSLNGLHKYYMLFRFFRTRKRIPVPKRSFGDDELPPVTIQLPLFNEEHVVARLLDAVCGIRYPKDRLEIQVLDDSTGDAASATRRAALAKREDGHPIVYIHREDRTGYKAGALAAGLEAATGELVAVFDADFVPAPDFLEKTVHHFTDPGVGMVQMRWDHLNRRFSFLTNVQAIFLDGHFVIESTTRCRSGCFVNFNGTAGVWRRSAIEESGGWQHDTVTEDLDLSYRAQLAGYRFVYLMEEGTPAELPVEMNAFKSQQRRWAKGTVQTMKKLLPRIWRADLPLEVKVEATFHLTSYVSYLCMVLLLILMLPSMIIRLRHHFGVEAMVYDLAAFVLVTVSFFAFYLVSQTAGGRNWKDTIRYLPFLMAVGIGLAVNNSRAVLEGLFDDDRTFVRTPKYGVETAERSSGGLASLGRYAGTRSYQPVMELALGAYFVVILFTTIHFHAWLGIPFTLLFMAGFVYVGSVSILECRGGGSKKAQVEAEGS